MEETHQHHSGKTSAEFANVSEKAFYTSRRRLIASELIRIQEQLPAFDTRGNRRQGHTAYSMLLRPKPYEELGYDLLETFAPQLNGPQLVLWLVITRNERNGAFWFATLTQLEALTGYKRTAIKEARNVLLEGGLIDGYRGFRDLPVVAGYRSLASPIEVESRRWADLPCSDLWYHLQKQQFRYTDISTGRTSAPTRWHFTMYTSNHPVTSWPHASLTPPGGNANSTSTSRLMHS